VNGGLVKRVQCCNPPDLLFFAPIEFTAHPGDTLSLVAFDYGGPDECNTTGRCYRLDTLYLHKPGMAPVALFAGRIAACDCTPRVPQDLEFFRRDYVLP
jgi:hypothetical protein